MTWKDLLIKTGPELMLLTDAQLAECLSPYFKFARPETGAIKKPHLDSSGLIPSKNTSTSIRQGAKGKGGQDYLQIQKMLINKAKELGIKL